MASIALIFTVVSLVCSGNAATTAAEREFYSMMPKSGYRFSENIMLKQQAKAK